MEPSKSLLHRRIDGEMAGLKDRSTGWDKNKCKNTLITTPSPTIPEKGNLERRGDSIINPWGLWSQETSGLIVSPTV